MFEDFKSANNISLVMTWNDVEISPDLYHHRLPLQRSGMGVGPLCRVTMRNLPPRQSLHKSHEAHLLYSIFRQTQRMNTAVIPVHGLTYSRKSDAILRDYIAAAVRTPLRDPVGCVDTHDTSLLILPLHILARRDLTILVSLLRVTL